MLVKILTLTIFSVSLVLSKPFDLPFEHAIRTNLIKNIGINKNSEELDSSFKKGEQNNIANIGFSNENAKNFGNSEKTGHFSLEDLNKKLHEHSGSFLDENFKKAQGNALENVDKKNKYKKGHHKTGFTNSYHKDESGGSTSFYDDGHNEGGEEYVTNQQGAYGNLGKNKVSGAEADGKIYSEGNVNHGGYNGAQAHGTEYAQKNKFDEGKYLDDKNFKRVNKFGDQYGEQGLVQEEEKKYISPTYNTGYPGPSLYPSLSSYPSYSNPSLYLKSAVQQPSALQHSVVQPPIVSPSASRHPVSYEKSKITVYEDPRVPLHSGYTLDGNIEFRPPPPYYDRRSSDAYDYYY